MHRRNVRARVAVGAAVLAIAGSAAIAPLSASATTAPPSTEPTSSEPVGESVPESSEAEVPELDEERAALVDGIVDASDDAGVPLDWDCVAVLVAQVSDADVAVIASQITAEVQATEATAEAEEVPEESEATEESDVTDDSAATTESAIETGVTDTTVTMESMPALSPEAEALGLQLIYCASGDADPELVGQVLALIAASEIAAELDLVCTEAVLTTFADETLELIIANGAAQVTELAETPDVSIAVPASTPETSGAAPVSAPADSQAPVETVPEEAFADAATLLACTTAMTGDMAADTAAPEPASTELVTETTGA